MTLLSGEAKLWNGGVRNDDWVMNSHAIHIAVSITNYEERMEVAFITLEV
jgi:hypothetical protein